MPIPDAIEKRGYFLLNEGVFGECTLKVFLK